MGDSDGNSNKKNKFNINFILLCRSCIFFFIYSNRKKQPDIRTIDQIFEYSVIWHSPNLNHVILLVGSPLMSNGCRSLSMSIRPCSTQSNISPILLWPSVFNKKVLIISINVQHSCNLHCTCVFYADKINCLTLKENNIFLWGYIMSL